MHLMTRLFSMASLAIVSALVLTAAPADGAPKKKYHFELTAVTAKAEVKADVAKAATPRVEAQVKKAFESDPQLVATLEGAPEKDQADAYRKYLAKKAISGSYLVTVEITEASEEVVPFEGKPNSQRLVVHLAIHMLGETIPGRTMGFTGDGQATIKQEIGMKVRNSDRQYSWDQAAEIAVNEAIETSLKKLGLPQKK